MKKLFWVTSGLLVCSSFYLFVSCKKERTANVAPQQELAAFQQLEIDLSNFNAEFFKGEAPKTRGGWWDRFWTIVGCDAGGAMVGSIAGAPGAAVVGIISSVCAADYILEDEYFTLFQVPDTKNPLFFAEFIEDESDEIRRYTQ